MSLLQSSLLLLSLLVLSSWRVSSGTFIVTQSPDVSVMEGETFSITCCWPGKFERIGVNWLKNQTVIKAETNFNQSQGSLKKEEKKCSSLNFSKIQIEDSGTYMCKVTVEIPSLFEAKGNGTVITVKKMGRNGTFVTVKAEIKKDKGNGTVITIMPEVKKDDNTDQHIARRVSSGILVVTQSPDFSVMEGETVSITCCWPGKFERIGVQWLKNQTVIKTETNFNQSKGSLKKEEKKCSSLNISNIRTEDSGTYICKVTVEIPSLTEAKGNGTVITVKAKKKEDKRVKKDDNTDQHIALEAPKEEVFTFLMRTLPVLALITAFFWLYYVGTRAQQNSQASSGNKPTSSQKQEQDEEERDGRAVEAANEC